MSPRIGKTWSEDYCDVNGDGSKRIVASPGISKVSFCQGGRSCVSVS